MKVLHSSITRNFAKAASILKRTLQSVSISVVEVSFLSLPDMPGAITGLGDLTGADYVVYFYYYWFWF